jgi:hypothetical protein
MIFSRNWFECAVIPAWITVDRDPWTTRAHNLEEPAIDRLSLCLQESMGRVDPRRFQVREPMGGEGMGIFAGYMQSCDTRLRQEVGAARSSRCSLAARGKRDEDLSASSEVSGVCESDLFCMRPSAGAGCALANQLSAFNDDASDGGVGRDLSDLAASEHKRAIHPVFGHE